MGIKSKFLKWFGNVRFYKGPFFIILTGETTYKIKGHHTREIVEVLKPGDILLRRYDTYLSSVLIPGYWSHVAIYVGDDKVVHAVGEGVVSEDILAFTRCDDIVVLRSMDEVLATNAVEKAHKELERKAQYDFEFDLEEADKFYCSELISFCYDYPECLMSDYKYLLPDKFLECKQFTIIWKRP